MVNPTEAYRQQRILNAPPEHLTLMLYNGCIKFIDDGREALEKKDFIVVPSLIVLSSLSTEKELSLPIRSLFFCIKFVD